MQAARLFSAVLFATLTTTASLTAAGPPSNPPQQLFTLESSAQAPEGRDLADAAEEFLVDLDPATVAANPRTLRIDLPGHPPLEAVRRRFVEYQNDWMSWSGTLREAGSRGKAAGVIHLGYHGDRLTALIDFEGETYRIVGGGAESHRLARLSADPGTPLCGLEDSPADSVRKILLSVEEPAEDDAPAALATAGLTTVRLDILALYPKAFFNTEYGPTAESALITFVRDSIDLANLIFNNSNVGASYNLVGIVPITGTSQPGQGVHAGLDWINGEPLEVTNLRNAFGADLVAVFLPQDWESRGCLRQGQPAAGWRRLQSRAWQLRSESLHRAPGQLRPAGLHPGP